MFQMLFGLFAFFFVFFLVLLMLELLWQIALAIYPFVLIGLGLWLGYKLLKRVMASRKA